MFLYFLTEMNECAINPLPCTGVCENTVGSYTCTCPSSFKMQPDGVTCLHDNGKLESTYYSCRFGKLSNIKMF